MLLQQKQCLFTNKRPRFIYRWASFARCIGMIHRASGVCLEGVSLELTCRWRLLHQRHEQAQTTSPHTRSSGADTHMGARDGNERQQGAACTCKRFVILCKHLLVGKPGTSSYVIASKGRKQHAWKKVEMSSHSVCSEYAGNASVPSPVCI